MRALAIVVVIVAGTGVAAAQETELPRLFVVDLRAETGIDPSHVRLLNEILLDEVQRTGRFNVFAQADLKSMVEVEQSKQLMGCEDDVSCLAEIGGAIGADLSLSGSVGALGKMYVLSLKIISNREIRVVGRWSETATGEPSVLVEKIKGGIAQVLAAALGTLPAAGPDGAAAAPTPAAEPAAPGPGSTAATQPLSEIAAEEPTPIYKTWWLWTAVGVVAAGTAAGIAIYFATSGGGANALATVGVEATLPLP